MTMPQYDILGMTTARLQFVAIKTKPASIGDRFAEKQDLTCIKPDRRSQG
jgi:hypothetical protein